MLENKIQTAFRGGHVLASSFDMEAAYDRAWKKSALLKLIEHGIRGNMLRFIRNFLGNRSFRILVGNSPSTPRQQQNEIPQGSMLRATVFLLIINDIRYCVTPPIQSFEFVDDRTIYLKGNELEALEAEMLQVVDHIVEQS